VPFNDGEYGYVKAAAADLGIPREDMREWARKMIEATLEFVRSNRVAIEAVAGQIALHTSLGAAEVREIVEWFEA